MKGFKKWLSFMLAVVMVIAMAIPVAAAPEDTYTLTINSATGGHTYQAYQVFKGDYSEVTVDGKTQKTLANIDWGTGVEGTAFLAALKTDGTIGTNFTSSTSADDVATVLQGVEFASNSENLDAFAAIAGKHLTGTSAESTLTAGTTYTYTIEGLGGGYYLVKDKDKPLEDDNNAYTKFILQMVESTTVNAKAEAPDIDKKIEGTGGDSVSGESNIGDTITFKLTSQVPQMDGYNRYYFIVNDTLSAGLDYVGEEEITIGNTELTKDTDYAITVSSTGTGAAKSTAVKIVFKDFLNKHKGSAGEKITITYKARLNEYAKAGVDGNENEVTLTYSNNPNYDYEGNKEPDKPDEPGENTPTDTTTTKKTFTYTTKLRVMKVDENGKPLPGAEFKLSGDGLATTISTSNQTTISYVQDANGDWVVGDDGEMRAYAPATDTGKTRYKQVTVTDTVVTSEGTKTDIKVEVDENGCLVFKGLGAGTYELEETKTPAGFNALSGKITIVITSELPDTIAPAGDNLCVWKYYVSGAVTDGNASAPITAKDGFISITVENKQGAMLPSTGGVGTTIFTIAGLALMLGAIIMLAKKNRRDETE